MQVWPQLRNLAQIIRLTVRLRLHDWSMMVGLDPPSSRINLDKFLDASFMTNRPTMGLPMKTMASKGRQFKVLFG